MPGTNNPRTIRCPKCATALDPLTEVRYTSSFRCTNCSAELQVPRYYLHTVFWLAFAAAVLVCLGIGLRDGTFVLGLLTFLFPAMFSIGILQRRFFPPKLSIY